jgi:hypothetical protein
MEPRATHRRDPLLAAVLSAVLPGAGLLYSDQLRTAAIVLGLELSLLALDWWLILIPIHALQIVVAAGTASTCGEPGVDVFSIRRDRAMTEQPESSADIQ